MWRLYNYCLRERGPQAIKELQTRYSERETPSVGCANVCAYLAGCALPIHLTKNITQEIQKAGKGQNLYNRQ